MTLRNLLFCFFMVMISVSCIREEAPNAEADILSCTVDGDILKAEPEIDKDLYGALYRLRRKHGISFRAYNDGAEEWTLPDIL